MGATSLSICAGLIAAVMAGGATGCWYAAVQLAPVGAQVAEGVSTNVLAMTGRQTNRTGVIELRQNAAGAPEYRELRIDVSSDDPRWIPVSEDGTSADGWRPAVNFLRMNFTPPLAGAFGTTGSSYLAYAPANPGSAEEKQQLVAFNESFGAPIGTFTWNGRAYQYSLLRTLPVISQLD